MRNYNLDNKFHKNTHKTRCNINCNVIRKELIKEFTSLCYQAINDIKAMSNNKIIDYNTPIMQNISCTSQQDDVYRSYFVKGEYYHNDIQKKENDNNDYKYWMQGNGTPLGALIKIIPLLNSLFISDDKCYSDRKIIKNAKNLLKNSIKSKILDKKTNKELNEEEDNIIPLDISIVEDYLERYKKDLVFDNSGPLIHKNNGCFLSKKKEKDEKQ
ncbi:hypothetical protein [Lyticum sinuosum]|uniref:Uncharacterized protein n=1 Tax=Lyticum sinuosum TaxID=1332059 RepID=A0AAE4VL88_9RICK|nr:hypothetical protein [Lyticum sinuosum]MDZ5761257.1 hypothetical protein [Lyticum sinuosum]